MRTATLSVPNISCEHCERTIKRTLEQQPGIQAVSVDIPAKSVQVSFEPSQTNVALMTELLAEEDYPVAAVTEAG